MYNLSFFKTGVIVLATASSIGLATRSPLVAATPQQVAKQITVQIIGNSNRGSGVIVSRNGDSFSVLTNAHVVSKPDNYQIVTADGVSHQLGDRTILPNLDLALLSFSSDSNYAVAAVDNSLPSVGETIYVAGYPRSGGSLRQPIFKVTGGEVRSSSSALPLGYTLSYSNLIRAGMSGGAILNTEGNLIGINGVVRLEAGNDRAIASGIPIDRYLQWRGIDDNNAANSTASAALARQEPVNFDRYDFDKVSLAKGSVNALAYNNSNQTLISASSTGQIDLWQLATRNRLASWQAHQSAINAIALASNGKILATGGEDGKILIWDLAQNKLIRTLKGHVGAISDLVFAADGNTLFSSSWDRTVRQWQIASSEEVKRFTGHSQIVNAIALTPDGKILVGGGRDRVIYLWDVATARLQDTLPGHSLAILDLDISADGKTLVSSSGDGTIKVWNFNAKRLVRTLKLHSDGVWQVAIAKDLQTLISGSWDKTVKVWNLNTGTLQYTLTEHDEPLGALAIVGRSKMFVSGDWQGQIYWWQLENN